VPLMSILLKFLSLRISHCTCCSASKLHVLSNKHAELAGPSQQTACFCIKIRGHVVPLSGTSVPPFTMMISFTKRKNN
jgi:hypothetical protein